MHTYAYPVELLVAMPTDMELALSTPGLLDNMELTLEHIDFSDVLEDMQEAIVALLFVFSDMNLLYAASLAAYMSASVV